MPGREREEGRPVWTVRGVSLTLAVYLMGTLALAWAVTTGLWTEERSVTALAVLAVVSSFLGGRAAVRRCPQIPAALLSAGLSAGILVAAGAAVWKEIRWDGSGWILLLCFLGGGIAAEAVGRGGRDRRRTRPGRAVGRA